MDRMPIERLAAEPDPDRDGASLVTRVGSVVAGGTAAAVVASLPAVLRAGGSAASALEHWIVLAGIATPFAVAAVAALRRARVGLRLVAGERSPALAFGLLWWSVLEGAILAAFGALLRKTTHHHALAGVTFAMFALVSGIIVALLVARAVEALARGAVLRMVGLALAGGAALLALVAAAVHVPRADGMHAGAALVDVLALGIASILASSRAVAGVRPMALAGVPVAVIVVIVGLTTLRFDESLHALLAETAPVHRSLIELFGG